jgi:hypothetical protein
MNGTTGVWAKVTIVAMVTITLLGTVVMAYAEKPNYDCPDEVVVVLPDDTLWGIAEVYCTDPRAVISGMRDQNPHIGELLFPGDRIQLPQSS